MEKFLDKIMSGRFLVTMMMCTTYCYLVAFMVTKLSDKISGDFILGFIGGFSTSFVLIIQWYFDKNDDNTTKGKEIENEKTASI